jgi:hypothetical protein
LKHGRNLMRPVNGAFKLLHGFKCLVVHGVEIFLPND